MINKSNGTNLSFADYAQEWQSIWMNVLETNCEIMRESVQVMLPNLQQKEEFPATIFDPEIVMKTLQKAMKVLSKNLNQYMTCKQNILKSFEINGSSHSAREG